MQIVSTAALRALFVAWRQEHYSATGHWVRSEEIELLIYKIAGIIQQPAPGEKIYSLSGERITDAGSA